MTLSFFDSKIISKIETYNPNLARKNNPKFLIMHSTKKYSHFEEILNYHKNKGWDGAGYHLFIDNCANVFQARPFDKEGAHALGYNTTSIGLCIYSQDGTLNEMKIQKVKSLIDKLNKQFNGLELLSHTQAQVRYNNFLLEKYGLTNRFCDSNEIILNENFEKLQKEMQILAGELSTDKYRELKEGLKSFKNCPGEMYFNFI